MKEELLDFYSGCEKIDKERIEQSNMWYCPLYNQPCAFLQTKYSSKNGWSDYYCGKHKQSLED